MDFSEEFTKTKNFLEVVGVESGRFGGGGKPRRIESHVGIDLSFDGASGSGTISFHWDTHRFPGRLPPR